MSAHYVLHGETIWGLYIYDSHTSCTNFVPATRVTVLVMQDCRISGRCARACGVSILFSSGSLGRCTVCGPCYGEQLQLAFLNGKFQGSAGKDRHSSTALPCLVRSRGTAQIFIGRAHSLMSYGPQGSLCSVKASHTMYTAAGRR